MKRPIAQRKADQPAGWRGRTWRRWWTMILAKSALLRRVWLSPGLGLLIFPRINFLERYGCFLVKRALAQWAKPTGRIFYERRKIVAANLGLAFIAEMQSCGLVQPCPEFSVENER
ncbi:MAG: hypothetical protein HOO93_07225 [Methyloglobulus sp.]|nr:hypothetical protein [Methyloglobulus sp.]